MAMKEQDRTATGARPGSHRTPSPARTAVWMAMAVVAGAATAAEPSVARVTELRSRALQVISPIPDKAPGADKDSVVKVALGRRLFFEKRLSKNNSQSCNSCHGVDQRRGGVDNEATSPGAFGKRGGRNSPTVLNSALSLAQFWDGRAESLEAQAKGPVLNPIEMAMPDATEVMTRLKADPAYPGEFAAAFPGEADPLTYDNVAAAIAAFERTLLTRDRCDEFLKGRDTALDAAELRGLEVFLTVGCTACHQGPLLGGTSFQKFGLVQPVPGLSDKGRFDVTKDEADLHKFKVPTLRNIAATGPYLHDGSARTLEEVIRLMARHQLGTTLSQAQESDLVSFLRSLTGPGIDVPRP